MHYNLGNLWTEEFLDTVIHLNEKYDYQITSLYGSLANMSPSARPGFRVPERTMDFVSRYTDKALTHGINIRWTLNQACIGNIQEFDEQWHYVYLTLIHTLRSLGIREWTIASPLIMEQMAVMFPDDYLEVSTIAEISSEQELARWHQALGANAANLSIMINRDEIPIKDCLRYADEHGLDITLLGNEMCLYRCPYRRECYNLSSHNSDTGPFINYPFSRCNNIRLNDPVEWIRARAILPQWVPIYEQMGVRNLKLTGRTSDIETLTPIIEAYLTRTYTGNLLDLWPAVTHLGNTEEPKAHTYIPCERLAEYVPFGKYWENCDAYNCYECGQCDLIYDKVTEDING